MKAKFKTSNRERWLLALAPAAAIGAIYFYGYEGKLSGDLTAANKRLVAAQAPLAAPGPSPALVKAKASLEDAQHAIEDEQGKVALLESRLAKVNSTADSTARAEAAAAVIGRVEAVFARNGITPLISESAGDRSAAARAPSALLAVLSPKATPGAGNAHASPRVWHYVFDDVTLHFQHALADLTHDVPSVVPLSLNFVYNPRNDGETREMELWILY